MSGVSEEVAAVARRQRVYFGADLSAVRKYINDAVTVAINQAAGSARAVREWCDAKEAGLTESLSLHNVACSCEGCEQLQGQLALVEEVRCLLPPVPEPAGEVEMRDREYPGGTDSGN